MNNYMSMGGRTMNVPSGGGGPLPYEQTTAGIIDYAARLRREEEARRAAEQRQRQGRGQGQDLGYIFNQMYGGGGGQGGGQGGGSMGGGAPYMSDMPGNRYKTRGGAPRYHEQVPMGGTPGVWAIRNDEIGGPQRDAPWIKQARDRHNRRRSRYGR